MKHQKKSWSLELISLLALSFFPEAARPFCSYTHPTASTRPQHLLVCPLLDALITYFWVTAQKAKHNPRSLCAVLFLVPKTRHKAATELLEHYGSFKWRFPKRHWMLNYISSDCRHVVHVIWTIKQPLPENKQNKYQPSKKIPSAFVTRTDGFYCGSQLGKIPKVNFILLFLPNFHSNSHERCV